MLDKIEITSEQVYKLFFQNDKKEQVCVATKDFTRIYSVPTGISNLRYHIREDHQEIYKKLQQDIKEQQTISEYQKQLQLQLDFGKITKIRQQKIDNYLLRFIFQDMRPFHLIQCQGFQNFMKTIEPNYKIPHRTTLSNNFQKLYKNCKDEIITIIKNEQINNLSLTCDYWTSPNSQTFLTLTIHFITSQSILYGLVLKTEEVKESHTSTIIAEIIQKILKEYSIEKSQYIYRSFTSIIQRDFFVF